MNWTQIGIALLGIPALWLVSRPEQSLRKWGFVFGLAAQFFWYWASIEGKLWGILIVNIFYTYSWCQGIYFNFIKHGGY